MSCAVSCSRNCTVVFSSPGARRSLSGEAVPTGRRGGGPVAPQGASPLSSLREVLRRGCSSPVRPLLALNQNMSAGSWGCRCALGTLRWWAQVGWWQDEKGGRWSFVTPSAHSIDSTLPRWLMAWTIKLVQKCGFCFVELCHLILEYILKCGYVIHHFHANFLLHVFC